MKANITNKEIAAKLGLDHTTISRIRASERHPSMAVMMKIEMWLKWPLADQAVQRYAGTYRYADVFEQKMVDEYGEAPDDDTTAQATPA